MSINPIRTPSVVYNTQKQTSQAQRNSEAQDGTTIQSKNSWVSEADKRRQALDDKYRRINEQNKRFKHPEQHIFDKYKNPHSPYFRHDLSEIEREASLSAEISWLYNGKAGCYDMRDSLFRDEGLIHGGVEAAERKAFNRQNVNDQLKQLLEKYQISIPDNMKLMFTIDPNDYKLTVSGTDDMEFVRMLEAALNTDNNSKELFMHIIQSRSHDSAQFTPEKYDKYNLVRVIKNATGYDLKKLKVSDGKFITEDGTDIFEIYKKALRKNPYMSQEDYGVATAYYGSQLYALAKNGFDSIPDLFLAIGYENGSLQDIGQKESYGTGKTDWIKEWKESL